ncbi:flagellar basal body P-ring formation chaperone FlgA [Frateuria sp. STR12]|uniref:flagellar basal body P-ring formation chaperone FlgA n=1 Tax=Frateuria hangzhouensis TaxID=2995589 RepID=UPI0022608F52|nr:flagellar basal body P-ring formation chaperone FlgA [Frateuria sp. STR12]MCX7513119.1 flagellar basal body P-ring formation chaperone FlgA [Frateuria sp. STR12]
MGWVRRCLLLALLGTALPTLAAPLSEADLRAQAERYVQQQYAAPGSRVEVKSEPLDPRLRIADCPVPLSASLPGRLRMTPRLSVLVRCPAADGWTLRVPVTLHVWRQVLVASRPLIRGDGIVAADVHAEERDVTHLPYGYIGRMDQVAERSLARPVATGSVLTPGALGGRQMIRAGDHVQLLAELGGIAVRADGVALGSGDAGSRLRVRNGSSGRVVDAIVRAPGVVVALP